MSAVLTLNLQNKCGDKEETCHCRDKPPGIIAKREPNTPTKGFFKVTHQHRDGGLFTLGGKLSNINKIIEIKTHKGIGEPISGLTEVSVYYWNGAADNPILLGIKQNKKRKNNDQPKYYSRGFDQSLKDDVWSSAGNNIGKSLEYLLDLRNCQRNLAVPLEISDPTKPSSLYTDKEVPPCVKDYKKITDSILQPSLIENKYTVKEYIINEGGAQISRAAFGGQNAEGITLPKGYAVSRIRVYSYPDPGGSMPLMLQFIKEDGTGESMWFYSKDKSGRSWNIIDGYNYFYDSKGHALPDLTEKLDKINCNLNNTVDIYVRETTKKDEIVKYCHGRKNDGHAKKIYVELDKNVEIDGFGAYKHYMEGYNNFHVSGFNDYITPSGFDLPLKNVKQVLVFHRQCSPGQYGIPLVIYVDHQDDNKKRWYQRKDSQEVHKNVWIEIPDMNEDPYGPSDIEKIRIRLDNVAKSLGKQSCSQYKSIITQIGSNLASLPGSQGDSVVVDNSGVGEGVTVRLDSKDPYYEHENGGDMIYVNPYTDTPMKGYSAFKQTSGRGGKFTVKDFTVEGKEQIFSPRVTPAQDVKSVMVYFLSCDEKNTPLLIYIGGSSGDDHKWYENRGNGHWTDISLKLKENSPHKAHRGHPLQDVLKTIKQALGLNCDRWNALVDTLRSADGCNDLEDCEETHKQLQVQQRLEQGRIELGEGRRQESKKENRKKKKDEKPEEYEDDEEADDQSDANEGETATPQGAVGLTGPEGHPGKPGTSYKGESREYAPPVSVPEPPAKSPSQGPQPVFAETTDESTKSEAKPKDVTKTAPKVTDSVTGSGEAKGDSSAPEHKNKVQTDEVVSEEIFVATPKLPIDLQQEPAGKSTSASALEGPVPTTLSPEATEEPASEKSIGVVTATGLGVIFGASSGTLTGADATFLEDPY